MTMTLRQLKTTEIASLRAHMLKRQDGICPICKKKIMDAVLDHQHKKKIGGTGQIRGVICRTCNVFLAKAENNSVRYGIGQKSLPDVLEAMAHYLRKKHVNILHPSEKPKAPRLTKLSYNRLKKFYEGKSAFPEYPKTGKLTVKLKQLFDQYQIKPEFYK